MQIRSEALPYVLPAAVVAAGAAALGTTVPAAVATLAAVGLGAFFRDPERSSNAAPDVVLSPADGKVVEVDERPDGLQIAVFLSLLDVHVTRSPVAGHLVSCRRIEGGYRAAFRPEAAHNARYAMVVASPFGRVEIDLIAGAVARRIVPWVRVDQRLVRGQRLGLIRFGSRAEVRLPRGASASVAPGDRVLAGATPIAVARAAGAVASGTRSTGS